MDVEYYDMLELDLLPCDIRCSIPGQKYWYDMEGEPLLEYHPKAPTPLPEDEWASDDEQIQTLVVSTIYLHPVDIRPLLISILEAHKGVSIVTHKAWTVVSEHFTADLHIEYWSETTHIWFAYIFGCSTSFEVFVQSVAAELKKRDKPRNHSIV